MHSIGEAQAEPEEMHADASVPRITSGLSNLAVRN